MHYQTAYPPVKNSNSGYSGATTRQYVKYVPAGYVQSHSVVVGYLLWFIGFTGAHRFYYGKPLTGILWFFTFGLLGIGWLVDAFLIPSMAKEASQRYVPGQMDYGVAWVLLSLLGIFGIHRFYQMKIFTGILYLFTGGLFLIGLIYDILTLNEQVSERNQAHHACW
ncbi:MAG: TM2 domain-containing protein [Planctomycetota bacterium]